MPISGDGAPEAAARKPVAKRKSQGSARLTNGSELLPDVDGRSVWARLLRDTMGAMYRHLGGEDRVSETQRLAIRRVGALEAEMIFLEAKFAKARSAGGEPDSADLGLYCTLANAQRRSCEPLGWQSVPRDVTHSLDNVLSDSPAIESGGPPVSQTRKSE